MKGIIIVFFAIFAISCKHAEKKVEYYGNGKIASITFWKNDTLNGEAKYFYPNGILKKHCYYKKGILDSIYKEYYETGIIKIEKKLVLGKTKGLFIEYFVDGKPKIIRNCIIRDNETYVNGVFRLAENGDTIIKESNFFTIKSFKDTIKLGEHFKALVYLKAPYFTKSEMYIYFEIPYDTMYRRVFSDNYKFTYDYLPTHSGNYKMKGFIDEFIMVKENADSIKRSRYLYFDYNYYVKPN